jgi:hypothetical protein
MATCNVGLLHLVKVPFAPIKCNRRNSDDAMGLIYVLITFLARILYDGRICAGSLGFSYRSVGVQIGMKFSVDASVIAGLIAE